MQASDIINQIGRANIYEVKFWQVGRKQAKRHRKVDIWQVEREDLNQGEADLEKLESEGDRVESSQRRNQGGSKLARLKSEWQEQEQ